MQQYVQSLVNSGCGCGGMQLGQLCGSATAGGGKFGAAIGTPTYIDCRVALRALEQLEQAAHSPLHASIRHGAGGFNFDRDSHKQGQWETHSKPRSEESSCARIEAGQLIVLECGLGIPLTDLLAGVDP